jgi:hypothetical protein
MTQEAESPTEARLGAIAPQVSIITDTIDEFKISVESLAIGPVHGGPTQT